MTHATEYWHAASSFAIETIEHPDPATRVFRVPKVTTADDAYPLMLCQRVLRRLTPDACDALLDAPADGRVDFLDLPWARCRRVIKARSRSGREVRAVLDPGERVRHGDVLVENETTLLVVNVEACEVIAVSCKNAAMTARVALELGNLHLPVSISDTEICFPTDPAGLEIVEAVGGDWARKVRRFEPVTLLAAADMPLSVDFQVAHVLR